MLEITVGREIVALVRDHWVGLLLAVLYVLYLTVRPSPSFAARAAPRRVLIPPDLGSVPLLVWAGFVTFYTHSFFMWGHGPAQPAAIWGEGLSFLRALAAAGVILLLEGVGLEVAARRGISVERLRLTGFAVTLRVVVVGAVTLDWGTAALMSTAVLLQR